MLLIEISWGFQMSLAYWLQSWKIESGEGKKNWLHPLLVPIPVPRAFAHFESSGRYPVTQTKCSFCRWIFCFKGITSTVPIVGPTFSFFLICSAVSSLDFGASHPCPYGFHFVLLLLIFYFNFYFHINLSVFSRYCEQI